MSSDKKQPQVSRRSFLHRVGAAGGSAAVYRSMVAMGMLATSSAKAEPFALDGSVDPEDALDERGRMREPQQGLRVVIVGAGIAGMTAAYELSRAGYRCMIFEGRDQVGGRCETVRRDGVVDERGNEQRCRFSEGSHLYFNMGAARIPFHHRALLGYCKQFGVELETFTNDNRAAYFYDPGKLGNAPIRGMELDTNIRGYVAELLSKSLRSGDLSDELSRGDQDRLVQMLRSFGDLDRSYRYRGSGRAGYEDGFNLGRGPSPALAPRELSALLDTDFWSSKYNFAHQTNQSPTLLQPVGGMSKIAEAFQRVLEPMIQLECKVTGIFKQADGVRVEYRHSSGFRWASDADYVIVTTSAPVVLDMDIDLSRRHRNALAGLSYSRAGKLAFEAPRFWEEEDAIYGGISWTSEDITQMWYPPHGFHRESGIIGGAYIWDSGPGNRFANMSIEGRIAMGRAQGERIHPGYANKVRHGISRSWARTDWVRGGWRQGRPNPVLSEPDGRIYFAGEHTNALAGWQEGAVISAQEAVAGIHARVRGS